MNNTICSGVYEGRNYYVDLSTIQPVKLEDLKKEDNIIYGISGCFRNISEKAALYIGSSSIPQQRIGNGHFCKLKNDRHENNHLQGAFKKEKVVSFCLYVLENCKNEEELLEREQNWLDFYNGTHNHKCLFNISKTSSCGTSGKDYIITFPDGREEQITNLSRFCRKNNLNSGHMASVARGECPHHRKFKCREVGKDFVPFIYKGRQGQFNKISKEYIITKPNGEEIIIKGLTKFCRENDLVSQSLFLVAKGGMESHKGYKCRFNGEENQRFERIEKGNEWLIFYPDGREEKIINLQRFCKEQNLSYDSLSRVARGDRDNYKGYKCSRLGRKYENLEDSGIRRKYKIIYPDGKEIIIDNLNKFAKENDLGQANLHNVAKGITNQHKGFRCKFL